MCPHGHIVQQFGAPRDIKLLNYVSMELMISVLEHLHTSLASAAEGRGEGQGASRG